MKALSVALLLAVLLTVGPGALRAAEQTEKETAPIRVKTQPPFTPARAKDAIKKALVWFKDQQNADGSYGSKIPLGEGKFKEIGDVGITGLVVMAMADSPMALRSDHGPFVSKAVDYLLAHANDDGSIAEPDGGLKNYKTSIAVMALAALKDGKKYDKVIAKARDFIVGLQATEANGYDPDKHPLAYGGFGYTTDLRPDLANTVMSLQALAAAGLEKDNPAWARAAKFISRCQNAEYNDYDKDREGLIRIADGGLRYAPDESKVAVKVPAGKRTYPSYLSMTYAGLLSFIHAQVGKNDPRVLAAVDWIRANYSVDANRGMGTRANPTGGSEGLYYCRYVMAKALAVYGEWILTGKDGVRHNWAWELGERLVAQQHKEGWWVNQGSARWWENNPVLVTCYAVSALSRCYENLQGQQREANALAKQLAETEAKLTAARKKVDNAEAIQALENRLAHLRSRMLDLSHPPQVQVSEKP